MSDCSEVSDKLMAYMDKKELTLNDQYVTLMMASDDVMGRIIDGGEDEEEEPSVEDEFEEASVEAAKKKSEKTIPSESNCEDEAVEEVAQEQDKDGSQGEEGEDESDRVFEEKTDDFLEGLRELDRKKTEPIIKKPKVKIKGDWV